MKAFLPEDDSDKAQALLARLLAKEDQLVVPDLIVSEFGHGLRKSFIGERLTAEDARAALADFLALPLETVQVATVAHDAWRLVEGRQGTFYDAVYVALAQARGCAVVAADGSMERAFRALGVVKPLSELDGTP